MREKHKVKLTKYLKEEGLLEKEPKKKKKNGYNN